MNVCVLTFQSPRYRSQPPALSAHSLRWSAAYCAKMLSSYDRFIRGKRWKSQGANPGGWWWLIKHFPLKTLRSLFVATAVCGRAFSWRTIPEDNIPRCIFWIKESNYIRHSTFSGRLLFQACLWAHQALRTDKCDVSRSTGILETLCNTSTQSFIWFSLWG